MGRLLHLLVGGVGAAVADVLPNGIGKEEHVLLHDADGPAQGALGHLPHVQPIHPDAALRDVIEPGYQLAQGALAAAGGAYDGHRLPGGHGEIDVVKDLAAARIGEADMIQLHLAPDLRQLHGVGGVLNGGLRGHQFNEPVKARKAVGEHLGKVGQLADGADEGGDIQAEGNEPHIVHLPLHDEPAAHGDDRHRQDADEELHAGVEKAHLFMKATLGGLEYLVGAVKSGLLLLLIGEGLGGADTGETGLDLGVDDAGFLLGRAGGGVHLAAAVHDHHHENGDDETHHQRQTPLDGEHDDQGAHDGHCGDEQILRAVVGQFRHLEQIGGQAAHQLAGAVAVVEVEAQLLHMAKQIPADIRLHPDAEGVAPIAHHEAQKGAQHKGQHHNTHDDEESAVLLLGQPLVHGGTGDQGKGQIHQRDHESADDIQCEEPAVGPEITEENGQRPFGLKILGGHGALNLLFIYLPQRKRRCRFDFLLYHVFFRIASGGRWEF